MKISFLGTFFNMGPIGKPGFLIIAMMVLSVSASLGQNQYLSTLNYQSLAVNRLVNIPGVMKVTDDNTTYDENGQRFFFQGNATGAIPFDLYTVDAGSGAIIYSPVCPSNDTRGQIFGLQYDNATDTLYAIYHAGSGSINFSWIEPATGIVHIINPISGFAGYQASVFDRKDHLYICQGPQGLLVIDAATGNVQDSPLFAPLSNVSDLAFDNLTSTLYAVCSGPSSPSPQFDSITLATGLEHFIANLPAISIPQLYTTAIDEASGKYIFVASPSSNACNSFYLYVLDIASGNILSTTIYPYAANVTSAVVENVIEYSFDELRGILYALNWHPPASPENPFIHITVSANPICAGGTAQFTAQPGQGVINPGYQWQLNGVNAGANGPNYMNNTMVNGDSVRCIMTNNNPCMATPPDTSNSITMQVNSVASSVSIISSLETICSGDTAIFVAAPVNGGLSPSFQWLVNNIPVGADNDSLFADHSLADGDTVSCIMTGSQTCSVPVRSMDSIVMTVNPTPQLLIGRDTVITRGKSVVLNPAISGNNNSYQWSPVTGLNNPAIAQPVATPAATTTYRLTVLSDKGCKVSGELTISVFYPLELPNAFTPNEDGRNDVFRIPASSPQKVISFSVYNRWGERVFMTTDSNTGWNGTFRNRSQPAGTYVWKLKYEDVLTGKPVLAQGVVMLIR